MLLPRSYKGWKSCKKPQTGTIQCCFLASKKSKKLDFAVIMVDRAAYHFEMTSLFYKQIQHCESFKRCITKNSVLFPLHSNLYKNIKLNIDY